MSNLTYPELLNQVQQLYNDKRYSEALDLINHEVPNFPEQMYRLYFGRACLESLMGQTDQALDTLEEAVEAGYWYNQQQLREDSDLDPLQGLPKFEGLVEICLERQATAQAEAAPSLITLEPSDTSPASAKYLPTALALLTAANALLNSGVNSFVMISAVWCALGPVNIFPDNAGTLDTIASS